MPLVSVVLPVYNAAPYVAAAMTSVLRQTVHDLDLIVVDDASTDASAHIAASCEDRRVVVVQHDTNRGYPAAMNTGLQVASGRYVARMDADDVSAPNRLERQLEALEGRSYAFCGTTRYSLSPNGCVIALPAPLTPQGRCVLETWDDLMAGRRLFADPSVLVERQAIDDAGGYRTYQRSGQDVDLWLRLMERRGPAVTLVEPLYGRRLLPTAITYTEGTIARNRLPRELARQRRDEGSDAIMRGDLLDLEPAEEARAAASRWLASAAWRAAAHSMAAGDIRGGAAFLPAAIRNGSLTRSYFSVAMRQSVRCLGGAIGWLARGTRCRCA